MKYDFDSFMDSSFEKGRHVSTSKTKIAELQIIRRHIVEIKMHVDRNDLMSNVVNCRTKKNVLCDVLFSNDICISLYLDIQVRPWLWLMPMPTPF
jgi:hypothetical protein